MAQGNPHQIFYPPPEKPDPSLNKMDKLVFGADARRCPVLGIIFEQGSGALSIEEQRENHLRYMNKRTADALRRKIADLKSAGPKE